MTSPGGIARTLYRKVENAIDRHEKRRFPIGFSDAAGARPGIYFLTPDHSAPSGGIRVIYRHVDILNAAGFTASVLHRRRGFRCTWFENETRVTDVSVVRLRPDDLLVVPEVDVDMLHRVPPGTRHVIFNQNSHLTWTGGARAVSQFYAPRPALAAVVTVSLHNEAMLRRAFPGCPVRRVHLGIDGEMFHPAGRSPRPRIAYMPRRGRDDARQVLGMLEARGALDGWDVVSLDGLSHEGVAAALRSTAIFLAFTRQEGFGLPAAEAMACGAYVIGNDGFGGREFFQPAFCARIETGDIVSFADAAEGAIERERATPGWCATRGAWASEFVLRHYSLAREREDVTALYAQLLTAGPDLCGMQQ